MRWKRPITTPDGRIHFSKCGRFQIQRPGTYYHLVDLVTERKQVYSLLRHAKAGALVALLEHP